LIGGRFTRPPRLAGGARRTAVLVALVLVLLVACLAGVGAGATRVSPSAILRVLLQTAGVRRIEAPSPVQRNIILYVRLPRVVAALLVGAALAMGGTAMQGLFRNPMASPDILGVSTGASFGAVLAINTGLFALNVYFLPLAALAGALLSAALIYAISSHRGRTSLLFVVLAGLAISSLFNGLISAILLFSQQFEVSQFIFWTMGGLEGRMWRHITLPLPLLAPGMALLFFFSRELNLFALGEDHAHHRWHYRHGHRHERTHRFRRPLDTPPAASAGWAGPPRAAAGSGPRRCVVSGFVGPGRPGPGPSL
jgi:iron complex transport system permease protein